MFDRPELGEKCAVVHIDFKSLKQQELYHTTDLEEFKSLVGSTDAEVLSILTGSAQTPNPKYFIGTGKIEELKLIINANNIQLLLFLARYYWLGVESSCICANSSSFSFIASFREVIP